MSVPPAHVNSAVYRLRSRLAALDDGTEYILTLSASGYLVPDLPPAAPGAGHRARPPRSPGDGDESVTTHHLRITGALR